VRSVVGGSFVEVPADLGGIPVALVSGVTFTPDSIEQRSRQFAIDAIRVSRELATMPELWDAARQLVRAATGTGANHRAMRRARSFKEFAAKLQIVCEEVDESAYWLDIIVGAAPELQGKLEAVRKESIELRSIFAKARATTRRKLHGDSRNNNGAADD
jgi:four helix bundle protein